MCRAWRSLARDLSSNTPLAPVAHSAKSEAPTAGRCGGARRASGEERCAESAERCAPSEGPRASGWRFAHRTTRRACGASRSGFGAARAVRRASSERRRAKRPGASAGQKTDGSHLADLGFGMPRATSIEGEGEGFAVPPGGEGAREAEGPFFPVRVVAEGVTPSPKKSQCLTSIILAGRWLRSGHPRPGRAG